MLQYVCAFVDIELHHHGTVFADTRNPRNIGRNLEIQLQPMVRKLTVQPISVGLYIPQIFFGPLR